MQGEVIKGGKSDPRKGYTGKKKVLRVKRQTLAQHERKTGEKKMKNTCGVKPQGNQNVERGTVRTRDTQTS